MKIQPALLEIWLSEYERVPYNLGESSVNNFTLGELLSLTGDRDALDKLSLMNNDTHGSLRLREAIASLDKSVSPDNILVTAGTTEAILILKYVTVLELMSLFQYQPFMYFMKLRPSLVTRYAICNCEQKMVFALILKN